ncbi:hypothetical protein [Stenotrophomonas rhizophila]|uniref:hypothetical protein n=1 Tax=Stenotrophomonas rhizophila TaxID=216778 RepID=UPI0028A902FD|nr:hypothetical protein [Stenotrophomonas rhizophila]
MTADIEQRSVARVPADQLSILRHALGVGEDGCAPSYRNHFVTGEGGRDHALCMGLVAAGLMTRYSGNALSGGSDVFGATNAGRAAAVGTPPKLTPGERRYNEYLRTDSNLSFIDWLRSPYCPRFTSPRVKRAPTIPSDRRHLYPQECTNG